MTENSEALCLRCRHWRPQHGGQIDGVTYENCTHAGCDCPAFVEPFTREMVRYLRYDATMHAANPVLGEQAIMLNLIADRIAALLPPEKA